MGFPRYFYDISMGFGFLIASLRHLMGIFIHDLPGKFLFQYIQVFSHVYMIIPVYHSITGILELAMKVCRHVKEKTQKESANHRRH